MNNETRTVALEEDQIVALENAALCILENRDALSGLRDNATGGNMSIMDVLELALPVLNSITEQFNA